MEDDDGGMADGGVDVHDEEDDDDDSMNDEDGGDMDDEDGGDMDDEDDYDGGMNGDEFSSFSSYLQRWSKNYWLNVSVCELNMRCRCLSNYLSLCIMV